MPDKKPFVPDDLKSFEFVVTPALSNDDVHGAYCVIKASEDSKNWCSRIYLSDSNVAKPCNGEGNQKLPKFSPDGEFMAFLSDASGKQQIWILDLGSGIQRQLTSARYGIDDYCWLGKNAFVFETKWWPGDENYFVEMTPWESAEHEKQLDMRPQIIEDIIYKRDETFGVFDGSVSHICSVNFAGEQCVISEGKLPAIKPRASEDGKMITFLGRPHEGVHRMEYEVFVCDADGKNSRQLTCGKYIQAESAPCFTSDGQAVVYMAIVLDETNGGCCLGLVKSSLAGGKPIVLTPLEDNGAGCGAWCMPTNRSTMAAQESLFVCHDGYVYYLTARFGREIVSRIPENGGNAEVVLSCEENISAFGIANDKAICRLGTPDKAPYIALMNLGSGERLVEYQANKILQNRLCTKTHELCFKTHDLKAEIQMWVSLPEFIPENHKIPAVLYIHGGPTAAYVADYWHEFQVLTSSGIAVIYCNPRGSTGYGLAFASEEPAWGSEAVSDLLQSVDVACENFGCIDPERIGITGGSYGGYMTVKLAATTKRFRAAIGQRVLCNPATSYGTGDMGFYSASMNPNEIDIGEILRGRAKRSLLTHIDDVDIPFLILHGFRDYRCSFEQAEQLFSALKDRKPDLPVRMVMFPAGNHGVSRDGRPCDMIRHIDEMNRWFTKYLSKEVVNCD